MRQRVSQSSSGIIGKVLLVAHGTPPLPNSAQSCNKDDGFLEPLFSNIFRISIPAVRDVVLPAVSCLNHFPVRQSEQHVDSDATTEDDRTLTDVK